MPLFSFTFARSRIWVASLSVLSVCLSPARAQDSAVAGQMPEDHLPVLRRLLEAALKQSPQMITGEIGILRGQAGIYSDSSALWPQLAGGAQYAGNRASTGNSATTSEKGLFYNIGVSENFFAWGALANQSRIGRIDRAIAEKNYAQGYMDLADAIRAQYMGLIGQKIVIRNDRFNLKTSQSALDVAQLKLSHGQISNGEIVGFQLDVETNSLELARAEENFSNSRRSLARLTGLEDLADDDVPLDLPRPSYEPVLAKNLLTVFSGEGAKSTLQAQVYEMGIREADLNYKIQQVRLLPKFSAGTGYSLQNQTTATSNNQPPVSAAIKELTYNVGANWSIFDGFATRGAKLAALAQKRLAERQLKTYVENTLDQAQHMEKQLSLAARYMELTETRWNLADGASTHLQSEFKLGRATQDAVDQALAARYAADYASAAARADFLAQWSDFVSLVGSDPALNNLPPSYVRDNP